MPRTKSAAPAEILVNTLEIIDLDLDLIDPHPLNPRPWSDVHKSWVDEEKVEELRHNFLARGYDRSEPILVRPDGNGRYQSLRGHNRTAAAKATEQMETIPAVIREVNDVEAALILVLSQGKSVDLWGWAQHAYQVCQAYGGDGLMTVSDYAEKIGKARNTVSEWIYAAKLKECVGAPTHSSMSVTTAVHIATLPEDDWEWFTALYSEQGWSESKLKAAIAAVKAIQIPDLLTHWLNPGFWKREAAEAAANYGYNPNEKHGTPQSIKQLVHAAQKYLDLLPSDRKVMLFNDQHLPYTEVRDLKQEFLDKLPEIGEALVSGVEKLYAAIIAKYKKYDDNYKRWQEVQASEEEQRKAAETLEAEKVVQKQIYRPQRFGSIAEACDQLGNTFDLVLMVYPSDSDPDKWLPTVSDALRPGGVLACLCWDDELFDLHSFVEQSPLQYLEKRLWVRYDDSPTERFQPDHEDLYVAVKPGTAPFLPDLERLTDHFPNLKRLSDVIEGIPLNRPDLLGLYLMLSYAQEESQVLISVEAHHRKDWNQNLAVFTIAAKRLGHRVAWVEEDKKIAARAEAAIEAAPFFWEV